MKRDKSIISGLPGRSYGRTRFLTALLLLALVFGVTGCQTSAMQEAQGEEAFVQEGGTGENVGAKAAGEDGEALEDEGYIDEAYIDEHYGDGEEEDLSVYGSERKGQNDGSAAFTGTGEGTEQDTYQTDPVPEGMPDPVEPLEEGIDTTRTRSCTLYVECATILDNMGDLTEGKEGLVPSDGVIFGPKTVTFYQGESVYDVLLREMQNNRIHMESTFTPVYNSAYVEGINNLYEKDCGEYSGWMYHVNGWYPNYGCSRYQVQEGDNIEWHYTCDLGRDLGR